MWMHCGVNASFWSLADAGRICACFNGQTPPTPNLLEARCGFHKIASTEPQTLATELPVTGPSHWAAAAQPRSPAFQVILLVSSKNLPAQRLYERMGYELVLKVLHTCCGRR